MEVLKNSVSALNQFIADRYSSNHSVSNYNVYDFFKLLFANMYSSRHRISRRGSTVFQALRRLFINCQHLVYVEHYQGSYSRSKWRVEAKSEVCRCIHRGDV
ncbi:uncharacterized protein LOC107419443 [Ziziphus jujuba]|uniref:Uncharacterized protein LOC107419443 n=1 Tax=Ziziphus jujuba TaxID=326968 RepID=A0ABM3II35_ZIZJJ|nr:uncharacterized protein LOC107419443 [Ziziphus jujuba]XP_060670685.1 uncharacterized protein LOC107419443 [Ziziphus jujuba]